MAQRDDFVAVFRPLMTLLAGLIAAERFAPRDFGFPVGVTLLALRGNPARPRCHLLSASADGLLLRSTI